MAVHYPDLKNLPDADVVINSLFALISHARTGKVGKLRPFLNVQVQLWMRELRRLVAKVDSDEITYEIAHDLNVFIAAVNNRIIPMPSAINKTDVVSEAESITSEKCLLYVAMTRAQKGVYITSYGRPSEFLG